MKSMRVMALMLGLLFGVGLMLAVLRLSAADQPSPPEGEKNPCAGKRDVECTQIIEAARAEGARRFTAWVVNFIASSEDPRTLPQSPTTGLPAPPAPDVDAAVADAEIIIVGTVTDVAFQVVPPDDDPSGYPSVFGMTRVRVDRGLKGDPGKEIVVVQASGGPRPGPDWKTGVLAYSEATPYLLEGDRALLFLKKDEIGYYVQGWTGAYFIDEEDRLDAVTGNPFETSVEAGTLSEFSAEIATLVAAQGTEG